MRGWEESHAGRFTEGAAVGERAVEIFRRLGDTTKLAEALRTLGDCLSYSPDTRARGRDLFEESQRLYAQRGEDSIAGQVESQSAYVHWHLGDRDRARILVGRGLEHGRRFGDLWAIAMCTTLLGHFVS
ncbi:hypothetical protein [Ammonicoccus fulvus]